MQEDLCLIEASSPPGGPRLTAAVLCFPSRWRLHEKLGRPLAEVHGNVPCYGDRLARPVDRFMAHVRPGHIAARLNWSVMDDPTLFQPTGKWRTAHDPSITEQNAGERLFLRVERQTLRRLPASHAMVFGIRVHVYPLARRSTTPKSAATTRRRGPGIARRDGALQEPADVPGRAARLAGSAGRLIDPDLRRRTPVHLQVRPRDRHRW